MSRMSKFVKSCLLCLKDVNLEVDDNDGRGHSSGRRATRLSSSNKKGGEIQPLTLFQLVQHPMGVGSPAHQNIIQQYEGEGTCALCDKCVALSDDVAAVVGQISALQAILREMVGIIRGRILESDGKRRSKLSQGIDPGLLANRQSILLLSGVDDDEAANVSQMNVEIKVKVEEDDDDDTDNFLDIFQSEPDGDNNFVRGEHGDNGEADSDRSLFINPQTIRKNNRRVSKRKITGENHESTSTPKRGRLKKTQDTINKSSIKKRGKASRKFSCDTSSSSDIYQSECDQVQLDDTLEDKRNTGNGGGKKFNPKSFKCDSCSRSYDSKTLLNNHILYLHRHSCQLCKQRFRTISAKNAHEKRKHYKLKDTKPKQIRNRVDRPIPCLVCQRIFYRPSRLQIHMITKHETKDKPFVCDKCDKRFTLELNLERHLELHKVEKEKPVVCEVCDSRFEDTARLQLHAAIHRRNYQCHICNHSYFTKILLDRHLRTHTGEKPFQCDHCQECFIDKKAKQGHMDKIHSTPDQHHLCTICGKTFFNFVGLKTHLDRHEGKTQVVTCKTCEIKFDNYSALKRHNIEKHGHPPFVCDECGIQVTTKKGLKDHKKMHADDKPHKCDICNYRFVRRETLTLHMRSHSDERPFVCHHCGKGFKLKHTLKAHVKNIHTADYVVPTPFLCSHCGKAYPRQGFLDDHVRQAHTGERPFVCQVCNKGFAIKASLTHHMKSHGINSSREKGPRLARSKRDFCTENPDQ